MLSVWWVNFLNLLLLRIQTTTELVKSETGHTGSIGGAGYNGS